LGQDQKKASAKAEAFLFLHTKIELIQRLKGATLPADLKPLSAGCPG